MRVTIHALESLKVTQAARGRLEPSDSSEKLRVGLGLEEGIEIRTEVCQGRGECWNNTTEVDGLRDRSAWKS